ncbi:MAG: phosphoribosylaminoimidazole carboxylase, catalytic subunit [Gammaproteobacteria bacterium]|jgi:5-(carboxyamino)imidazole ribonucleotide mutase|nr:phosphoribosylaminoimidazole carboxylase, catalytic subunit [Gammaproteobacteria bacterium]
MLNHQTYCLKGGAMKAKVAIIMGSQSDWPVLEHSAQTLDQLGIPYEVSIVSAHRTPDKMFEFAESAEKHGIEVIIAGAGGAAHLPGMTAAKTHLPVLGVPMPTQALNGMDSLLSIVQMPKGIPVGTLAIGQAGAVNAAILAAAILAIKYPDIQEKLKLYRAQQTEQVLNQLDPRKAQ